MRKTRRAGARREKNATWEQLRARNAAQEQLLKKLDALPKSYCQFTQAAIETGAHCGRLGELAAYVSENPSASAGRVLGRACVLSCFAATEGRSARAS